jgi:hypothetical protein
MQVFQDLFTQEQLQQLRQLPEVQAAYEKISTRTSVSFHIPLTDTLRQTLQKSFQLDLSTKTTIPCRWIKGDTPPHIDRGSSSFDTTYLVYLTDGQGTFCLGDEIYPIVAASGFSFPEGVSHEVTGTNGTTRLLLGPMSEQGFAVGAGQGLYLNPGETGYIREESGDLQYSTDQVSWGTFDRTQPINFFNLDTTGGKIFIYFTTDITIDNNNTRFFLLTSNIQVGSTSLNSNGTRPIFTITVDNYDGLFQNGEQIVPGSSDISIYNILVNGEGHSLQIGAGWLGSKFFGNGATNNYIVNCSSSGSISDKGGGLMGEFCGSGSGASLTIIGCSSTGATSQLAGGILGRNAGADGGNLTCDQCFATGAIGAFAGGIFGDYAGDGGSITITKCYTTGSIGGNGGGICGRYAGNNGTATVSQCYSLGTIGADGGGIFGLGAAANAGIVNVSNCYSSGLVTTTGNGIFGTGKRVAGCFESNCYSANNAWSDSTANSNLTGDPISSDVGTVWVKRGTDIPYELNGIGYTPYSVANINSSSELIQSYGQTVQKGESSVPAIQADASGNDFSILEKSGGDAASYSTITISSQTGVISTTSATAVGTYTLTIRSIGSYFITTFVLTVIGANSSASERTGCCVSTMDERGLSYEWINDYKIGNRLILEVSQNPKTKFDGYSQYVKYKMAKGARKY